MAPTTITYEEAKEKIGALPSLAPCPNANNLRALTLHLEQRLGTIPSYQAPDHGYVGMVMPPEIYTLRTTTAWTDWPNPGPHPDPADNTAQQNNNRSSTIPTKPSMTPIRTFVVQSTMHSTLPFLTPFANLLVIRLVQRCSQSVMTHVRF